MPVYLVSAEQPFPYHQGAEYLTDVSLCPTPLALEQKLLGLGESAECDSHSSAPFGCQVFLSTLFCQTEP